MTFKAVVTENAKATNVEELKNCRIKLNKTPLFYRKEVFLFLEKEEKNPLISAMIREKKNTKELRPCAT